ncbi:MAG: hypothetical protein HRU18_18290 [Pseudoalteromonas sp.]|uniref:terminase small subunit n=1 Tax=Pseudoalteromonas sp. TaxID=53249 RepID=UPI001D39816E|nr:terminase small subunit [Pseudoalteromonas sp.]NRA80154.1 hypothetical protein [Pseudoalteromonas sp.]
MSKSVGRPTTYKPEYCKDAESFLAEGYSVAALAGHLNVVKSTIYEWKKTNEEFSNAVKRGQAKAVLFWEKQNIRLAQTGEGNATSIIFGLKNRAPDEWRDKVETEHSGKIAYSKVEREVVRPDHSDG